MGKRRIKWQPGDNFLVPLNDGTYGQGQVLLYEAQAMNSAICAFSSARHLQIPPQLHAPSNESLLAVLFVTRDLLDSGRWQIVNNEPIAIPWKELLDLGAIRASRHIGLTIRGSGCVADLLNACHKLIPWNSYNDPDYFDKLLISSDRKPLDPVLK